MEKNVGHGFCIQVKGSIKILEEHNSCLICLSSDSIDRWASELLCPSMFHTRTLIFPLKMHRQHITLDLQIHLEFTVSVFKLWGRRYLSDVS